jgi:hypothetical protein
VKVINHYGDEVTKVYDLPADAVADDHGAADAVA